MWRSCLNPQDPHSYHTTFSLPAYIYGLMGIFPYSADRRRKHLGFLNKWFSRYSGTILK